MLTWILISFLLLLIIFSAVKIEIFYNQKCIKVKLSLTHLFLPSRFKIIILKREKTIQSIWLNILDPQVDTREFLHEYTKKVKIKFKTFSPYLKSIPIGLFDLSWQTRIGITNPAHLAILNGVIWNGKLQLLGVVKNKYLKIMNQPKLVVQSDFTNKIFQGQLDCIISLKAVYNIRQKLSKIFLRRS